MFIGYGDDHDGDVYRMWNPKTKKGTYYSVCHLDETDDVHKRHRRASH
jgi:hypothetical protein